MSATTTKILAKAAGLPLCDCVVVGILPDGEIYLDWSGSTIASCNLFLNLGQREVMRAWDHALDLKKQEDAA